MAEEEIIKLTKFINNSDEIEIVWGKNVSEGKTVTKGAKLGKFFYKSNPQKSEVISAKASGKIAFLRSESIINEGDPINPVAVEICRIEPCDHPLIYNETCTICFEDNIKRDTQKIFENIGMISASDSLVAEKI